MSGVQPPAWQWRYLTGGTVLHALDLGAQGRHALARCGADNRRSGTPWRGEASKIERDHAKTLPRCGNCLRYINSTAASPAVDGPRTPPPRSGPASPAVEGTAAANRPEPLRPGT